ncbi:MAG: ankyrin repeat domain-containing protein [Treponema sp.]|nr:ankyrin repeat domain-containing protein [Treponema sp.]
MTYLILTDNELFSNVAESEICHLEKSAKIYKSDFQENNLKKIKRYLSDLSLCVIYSEKAETTSFFISDVCSMASICGYVIAKEIPVITNIPFLSKYTLFSSDEIKDLKTKARILNYIEKQYDFICNKNEIRSSKKALFEKGIPFTPDCFASYIAKDKIEICNLFLNAGIDINSRDDTGTPMINIAVRNDNEEFLKRLISLGADINAVSEDRGYTPVMDAVWRGNKNITQLLINHGAELNTINKEGQTNLILAVGSNKAEICKMLVENGADPDIKDQMGMSAYGYATLFRKEAIVEILKPYHKEN